MSSSDVQVAVDGAGKHIETVALTSDEAGAPTTQRQVVALGDGTTFANKAKVDASGNVAVSVSNLPGTQPVSGTVAVSSLPGSVAQDGTDSSDANATQATAGVGMRGWLSTLVSLFRSGAAKVTINGTPAVTVSGTVPTSVADGSDAALGTTTDASSANTVVGILKAIKAAITGTLTTNATIVGTPTVTANVGTGTQPVSGTVAVSGTIPTSVADGQNATIGTTTDASSAVTLVGLLKAIKAAVTGTLTTSVSNFPGTQAVSGSISVSNLPATQPVSSADGAQATIGATTDLSTALTLVGLLKNIKAALAGTLTTSVSNFPATQPVSGTVTANVGAGTMPTSVADGSNVAIGTTTDAASAFTVVGLLKNIKAALAGTVTISGAVTNSNLDVALSTRLKPADTLTAVTTVGAVTAITNALPTGANTIGAVTNANLDVALSTRLKPADTLAGVTTVAAVTAITNPLPAGTNTLGAVKQVAQTPLTATLATNVTSTTPTTGQSVLGYDGAITIELVAVGTVAAQAVTIQVEGSLDNSNWYIIGTAQIDVTANPAYTAAAFTLTPGNGTIRHLYAVRDNVAYIRLNPTANSLATGLSSSILANPV